MNGNLTGGTRTHLKRRTKQYHAIKVEQKAKSQVCRTIKTRNNKEFVIISIIITMTEGWQHLARDPSTYYYLFSFFEDGNPFLIGKKRK